MRLAKNVLAALLALASVLVTAEGEFLFAGPL